MRNSCLHFFFHHNLSHTTSPRLSHTWAQKCPTPAIPSRRSTEYVGWLKLLWETSGDHYSVVMTYPDGPSYEFTTPPFFLSYSTTPRPSSFASRDSGPASSRPSRRCRGPILCPMRSSTRGPASRTFFATLPYSLLGHVLQRPDDESSNRSLWTNLALEDVPTLCQERES